MDYFTQKNAAVLWCERQTFGLEITNTLSSFFFFIFGYNGYGKYQPTDSVYFSLALIGVTSGLFHATGNYFFELTDELSMIYFVYQVLLCYKGMLPLTTEKSSNFYKYYRFQNFAFISVYLLTKIYIIFIFCFAIDCLTLFYVSYQVTKRNHYARLELYNASKLIVFGKILWDIEQNFCRHFRPLFFLHSLWHFFSALAANKIIVSIKLTISKFQQETLKQSQHT